MRKPKFRRGQVVRVQGPNYAIVDCVWAKNFPRGYSPRQPLYQLRPNAFLLQYGSLMFLESELRPLTRREIGASGGKKRAG